MCAPSESFYHGTKVCENGALEECKQKPKEMVKINQNAIASVSKGAKAEESFAVALMSVGDILIKYLCL